MSKNSLLAQGSPERFGYSWETFHEILPIHEEQFKRWVSVIDYSSWQGAVVMDVGCGMGRNSFWVMKAGARSVLAIDVDERSLAAARINLSTFENAKVKRLSIYDIEDFELYDITFSIGVIHHLADPVNALQKMKLATKKGGKILIWVYGKENNEWIINVFDPIRKLLFSRLPIKIVYHLSLYPTFLLWFFLRVGLGNIEYFKLVRSFSFNHIRAIVFDQMLPRIANYWTESQVIELMEKAGISNIETKWINEMSWSAVGTNL